MSATFTYDLKVCSLFVIIHTIMIDVMVIIPTDVSSFNIYF